MKSKVYLSIISITLSFFAFSQTVVEEKRNYDQSFTGVDVKNGIILVLTPSEQTEILVSANKQKYLQNLITEVKDGILKVYYKEKDWNGEYENRDIKVKISMPTLQKIYANDGCNVKCTNKFTSDNMIVECKDGSVMKLNFDAGNATIKIQDGSNLSIKGRANNLNINVNDGSVFTGSEFRTKICNAKANDGSSLYLNVSEELTAKANDGSIIRYEGDGKLVSSSENDGATIKKVKE